MQMVVKYTYILLLLLLANVAISQTCPSQPICAGESYTLTAAAGMSAYQWYNNGMVITNATFQTYIASAVGNYSWAATSALGCRDTSCCTTSLIAGTNCNPCAGNTPQPICAGESYTLTAAAGMSAYQWYNNGVVITNATSQTYIASAVGTYSWAATSALGCRDTSCCTTSLIAGTNCNPCAGNTPQPICAGESYTLTAAAGMSAYQWYNNGVVITNATSQTYIASAVGTYSWAATSALGCRDTSCCTTSLIAGTNCNPCAYQQINVYLADTFYVCPSGTTVLTTASFSSYLWSTGETTPTITQGVGTFTVTVTDNMGCTASSSAMVLEYPAPNATVSSSALGADICTGETVTLTAAFTGPDLGCTVQWQRLINGSWSDIQGETGLVYTSHSLIQNTGYRAKLSCPVNCLYYSDAVTVNVLKPKICLPVKVTRVNKKIN
jgi:large repetitive protein